MRLYHSLQLTVIAFAAYFMGIIIVSLLLLLVFFYIQVLTCKRVTCV